LAITRWYFYTCEYGEHYKLATKLVYESTELSKERVRIGFEKGTVVSGDDTLKELHWIPMGVPEWGSQANMDYLYISHLGRTDEQIKWFDENYHDLSETQQGMLEEHIEDFLEL
jgi:hypothetical protein